MWTGVNSYFLHTLSDSDQISILTALKAAHVQVVRIFINSVGAGSKGSSSVGVRDLEQTSVGVYDDTVLFMIDKLMSKVSSFGMRLIIAIHDRYSLGCWASDAYVTKYNLPVAGDCGTAVNQPVNFYSSAAAMQDFDNRIRHVLSHTNAFFGGRPWSSLSEVVVAFDIQNESQGHMTTVNSQWLCGRAAVMKPLLTNGILVATGGGAEFADSLAMSSFQCAAVDIVALHTYDLSSLTTNLQTAMDLAGRFKKRLVVEEYGSQSSKAGAIQAMMSVTNGFQIPSMWWEVMVPNSFSDFELFTDDSNAWGALSTLAASALSISSHLLPTSSLCTHSFQCSSGCCTNVLSSDGRLRCAPFESASSCNAPSRDGGLGDWDFCAASSQCIAGCCSRQYSDDNMFKCTPGGSSCL